MHRSVERSKNGHEGQNDVGSGRGTAVNRRDTLHEELGERFETEPDGGRYLGFKGEAGLG